MNDKQRTFIEGLSERVAIMHESDASNTLIGSIYIDAVRTKLPDGTCTWDVERVKSLVSAMKEYGGLDNDIECIRDAWKLWMTN